MLKPLTVWKSLSCVQLLAIPWTIQSMEFSRPEYWILHQGILPTQGSKPRSSALQVGSLPAEPPGKPKNTGVGNLSLLQQIFLTQGLKWGLLHCRWILYQLSYQGSPFNFFSTYILIMFLNFLTYLNYFYWIIVDLNVLVSGYSKVIINIYIIFSF